VKEGTIWSRLSWARRRLQERLARRGVALSAALAAFALSDRTSPAALTRLTEIVSVNARAFAAGQPLSESASVRAVALAQTGLSTFAAGKLKLAVTSLLLVLLTGLGGAFFSTRTANPEEALPDTKPTKAPQPEPAAQPRTDRHGDPLPDGAIARLGTVRWRHGFGISALSYSPDGTKIAVVGAGRDITLWDAQSGKEIHQFPNKGNQPISLAFSPDGKILATTGRPCQLWDIATGKELRQLPGHQNAVRSIAFSPDGKRVATASADATIRLWSSASGKEERRIETAGEVCRLAYSPDGKSIASTSMDGVIHFWSPETGKEERQISGHKKAVWGIVFSPDGKRLATSSQDGTLRLWDMATRRQLCILIEDLEQDTTPIAFSPDGKALASGHVDGTIRLWDVKDGAEVRRWQTGSINLKAIAFSPDGKTLASGVTWGVLRLWDVATGRERFPSEEPHGFINEVRFSSDGSTLVSISRDRRMLWWNLAAQKPQRQFTWMGKGLNLTALSTDGNTLAVSSVSELKTRQWELRLWDVHSDKPGRLFGTFASREAALAFSPDGRFVAAGGGDHVIHIWDARNGKEIRKLAGLTSPVSSLLFSPEGETLACALMWGENDLAKPALYLFDVAKGEERLQFDLRIQEAPYGTPLAFSPDGRILASASRNATTFMVRLWNAQTGMELCRHTGHSEDIGSVAFSPDGKLVASGAGSIGRKDNSVHVWEAATGRLIRRFEGHHSCVGGLAFSPDGLKVASGAGDSTILLWDITGRRSDGTWHTEPLTPHELDACWTALATEDAAKAYDAVWQLVAAPKQAVPFLRKQLPPLPHHDAKAVERWIADLDSDEFDVRQKAADELSKICDAIVPALRDALKAKPSLEIRRRLQQLLAQTRDWTPDQLRTDRAIQALEHIGTRAAREVLQALAAGAPEARRTVEAKKSLRRLSR
jgi:WD40 repeat protein